MKMICLLTSLARNLINLQSSTNQYFNVFNVLPFANITNLSILNSKNASIFLLGFDSLHFQNILIENNTLSSKNKINPLLYVSVAQNAFFNNIIVKNNIGPVIHLQGALYGQLTNCAFLNVSNSVELPESLQFQIKISSILEEALLNQTKLKGIEIRNVSLNVTLSNNSFK